MCSTIGIGPWMEEADGHFKHSRASSIAAAQRLSPRRYRPTAPPFPRNNSAREHPAGHAAQPNREAEACHCLPNHVLRPQRALFLIIPAHAQQHTQGFNRRSSSSSSSSSHIITHHRQHGTAERYPHTPRSSTQRDASVRSIFKRIRVLVDPATTWLRLRYVQEEGPDDRCHQPRHLGMDAWQRAPPLARGSFLPRSARGAHVGVPATEPARVEPQRQQAMRTTPGYMPPARELA